jgi:rhodanese-related sulfurtransferase
MRYADLLAEARARVPELMPWDLAQALASGTPPLVLDVREPQEVAQAQIAGALHVPRGVLEAACEWDQDDTVPQLAEARDQAVVVVCRSGNRSLLAADAMRCLGFTQVASLRTGCGAGTTSSSPWSTPRARGWTPTGLNSCWPPGCGQTSADAAGADPAGVGAAQRRGVQCRR